MSDSIILTSGVSGRYATALFSLGKEENTLDRFEKDLGLMSELIVSNVEFRRLIDSPIYKRFEQERAVEIIELKRQKDRENTIKEFDENPDVKVLNGRYGAYISIKKKNFKIPKDRVPEELTLEDCIEISEDPKNQPKKRFTKRKK